MSEDFRKTIVAQLKDSAKVLTAVAKLPKPPAPSALVPSTLSARSPK